MRCYLTSIQMVITNKQQTEKWALVKIWKSWNSLCLILRMQNGKATVENSMIGWKIEFPYDPVIPILGTYPKELKAESWRDTCKPMCIAALSTTAKMWKQLRRPLIDLRDMQRMVCAYNGMLFSLKKEGNSDMGCGVEEPWGHYASWNRAVTKRQILYDPSYMRYLSSQKNRDRKWNYGCQGLVWGEGGSRYFMGIKFQFYKTMSYGYWWWWLHSILSIFTKTIELYTWKRLRW